MAGKKQKTNVIRLLEAAGIAHEVYTYDASDGKIDAAAVAEKLGKAPSEFFKTLVARGGKNIYVFCVPGNGELDLKKAAQAAREKKIELVAVKELLPLTGYVRGGCSPIGMKKKYPLFLDAQAEGRGRIIVSGGLVGVQVSTAPADLLAITGASTADLCAAGS
ncbi:MAG: Cys-tRNA(Pro) deacylase [Spirochaetales bacterium]|jgi:Cys-tRNA(Pro)/Cys-tRNA(Cys) deacylase|nr:Cys-tRNA(Pro) deacylase [Spirochaetales bacterium]